MELEDWLSDEKLESWEQSYRDYVLSNKLGIDDWIWQWLWFRIKWPSEEYSLFYKENVLIYAGLFDVTVEVRVGDIDKRRYVQLNIYKTNPYHPDVEVLAQVDESEWRFSSVGNPFIDDENYKNWEKLLFCKLLNRTLEEAKGLDFLIEHFRR